MATLAILVITVMNLIHLHGVTPQGNIRITAALSNASYAASFAEVQHNCVSAPIFGWTNDSELPSSIRSLELLTTNLLR